MKSKQSERRKFKRVLFTPEDGIVGVFNPPHDEGEMITAQVMNVSEGGLQLTFKPILKNRIKEGDRLLLTEIKGTTSSQVIINVDTEVRWISEDQLSKQIGIGCEFQNVLEQNKRQISEFVEFWYIQRLNPN